MFKSQGPFNWITNGIDKIKDKYTLYKTLSENIYGDNFLDYAITNGDLDTIKKIVLIYHKNKEGVPLEIIQRKLRTVFIKKYRFYTPIYSAIKNDHLHVVKYLIDMRIIEFKDIKPLNFYDLTPLSHAICNNNLEMVKLIIELCGKNIKPIEKAQEAQREFMMIPENLDRESALSRAIMLDNTDILMYLIETCNLQKDDIIMAKYTNMLHKLCSGDKINTFKLLVEKFNLQKKDFLIKDHYGHTLFHCTVKFNSMNIFNYLMSLQGELSICKEDVLIKNYYNDTILDIACQNGFLHIIKILINRFNIEKKYILTYYKRLNVLMGAIYNEQINTVKFLLDVYNIQKDDILAQNDYHTSIYTETHNVTIKRYLHDIIIKQDMNDIILDIQQSF